MFRWSILLVGMLNACATFPDVDVALSEGALRADYPTLLPFEDLLTADDARLTDSDERELIARSEALRARADGLRGPVIDDETRDRMDAGVRIP